MDLSEALSIFMRDFGGFGGLDDLFGGRGQSGSGPRSGADVKITLPLTLAEVATGVEKEVKLKVLDACDRCGGSGAEPGSKAHHVPDVRRPGRGASRAALVLRPVRHRRAVPDLQGRGPGHRHAVQEVPWRRTHARRQDDQGVGAGRASPPAST